VLGPSLSIVGNDVADNRGCAHAGLGVELYPLRVPPGLSNLGGRLYFKRGV
jgi:hypothetical protein